MPPGERATRLELRRITERIKNMVTINFEMISCLNEGENVVIEAQPDGVTNAGVRYETPIAFIFETRDGLITSLREYGDTRLVAEAFGISSGRGDGDVGFVRIERDVPADGGDSRVGLLVEPDGVLHGGSADVDAVVPRLALVRAVGRGVGADEHIPSHVIERNVLNCRIGRLLQGQGGTGVGDDLAVDANDDVAIGRRDGDRVFGGRLPDGALGHTDFNA